MAYNPNPNGPVPAMRTPTPTPRQPQPAARSTLPAASPQFLTLPFHLQPDMNVVQGWIYTWGYTHFGVDYIKGDVELPETWETFDVVAAADGEACVNCVDGLGNRVWIKHAIGDTVYYTYYGHLASIEPFLLNAKDAATVPVARGQKIGMAGYTGTYYIHLHFGVYNSARVPVDPYDIHTCWEAYYPNPDHQKMGPDHLFMGDPPLDPTFSTLLPSIVHRPIVFHRW